MVAHWCDHIACPQLIDGNRKSKLAILSNNPKQGRVPASQHDPILRFPPHRHGRPIVRP
jgi:hypothetical protein